MNFSAPFAAACRGLRWFVLGAVLFLGMASPTRVQASQLPAASGSPALFAGFTDYVIGNRSRMIQVTCIAFGLGVLILVTATRKH